MGAATSFFWYDNDKDLKVCFHMTRATYRPVSACDMRHIINYINYRPGFTRHVSRLSLYRAMVVDGACFDNGDRQNWQSLPLIPATPAHDKMKELLNKRSLPGE